MYKWHSRLPDGQKNTIYTFRYAQQYMTNLETHIRSTIQIGEELDDILSCFELRQIKKDKHIIREGQLMDTYYFILSGGLRVYFNHEEKEVTAWLSFENDWLIDISCIRTGRPTIYNILLGKLNYRIL